MDGAVNEKQGEEDSRYRAKCHETKKGFRFTAALASMLPPTVFG